MEFDLGLWKMLFLFAAAAIAGFVDSIAGGGGLITLPALLAVGVPPHMALGTNKLQSSFGSCTSALRYSRSGLVKPRGLAWGAGFTLIGAFCGTWLIQRVPAGFLGKMIPFVLAGVFLYTLFSPDWGKREGAPRLGNRLFYLPAGLLLGFYDGFFGPGTGSFWTIALIAFLGLDLKGATANTKVLNFTSNMVALILFAAGGKLLFSAGLLMAAGQIGGAWLGSHLVVRKGTGFIRIFFLAVVGITILRLFWREFA